MRVFRWILLLVVLLTVAAFAFLPRYVDGDMNRVAGLPPDEPDSVKAFHDSLFVVDLHSDQLLWSRDPVDRSSRGHTDVPRLIDGNVAFQVFSAVTKTPRGLNFDRNTGETDNITLLAVAQRWPVATWNSLTARALHQASRLHDAEARSNGRLTIVRSVAEMAAFLARHENSAPASVGALLAIEGLHALDGKIENLDTLYAAGYRMMGLTHFFDNELGGSAHGVTHDGLTPFGRRVVTRMNSLSIIIDLAHASSSLVDEVLALSVRPVVVSHTGVRATCPGPRNLTDQQIIDIAAKGGLIGIGYFEGAVCELSAKAIARAIRHVVNVAGIRYVALGSDFDGAVTTPWDTRGIREITAELMAGGMSREDIRAVMGGNARAFLLANLPVSSSRTDAPRVPGGVR